MKYYVVADPHGFYAELRAALEEKGFFEDDGKLIICGDLFDRGPQARELQDFILELMRQDRVILIRGNHEDLALDLLNTWHRASYLSPHHNSNGTVDTVRQLTGSDAEEFSYNSDRIGRRFLHSPYIQRIIPEMQDYFETEHYIFVHGWLPMWGGKVLPEWRDATAVQWKNARWTNGMEAAHHGARVPGKTVVCGHWNCSFGHARYEGKGSEHGQNADHSPYYGEGIIALDACTVLSRHINCIVLED